MLPAVPVVLVQAVLDGDDRVLLAPARRSRRSAPRRQVCGALAVVVVLAVAVELGWRPRRAPGRCRRRACSRPCSIASTIRSRAAALLSRLGAKPPSSPTPVPSPCSRRTALSAWKTSTPIRSPSRKLVGPEGRDHELLDVDVVVGVAAAVEDVHHRHGEDLADGAPDVAVKRQARLHGRGLGDGEADPEDGVGAQAALLGVPSRSIRIASTASWFAGVEARAGPRRSRRSRCRRPSHTLAEVAGRIAVAQLDGLVGAGRRAGGHDGRAADGAVSSRTSTSTVGARESRISRAPTASMDATVGAPECCSIMSVV